MQLEWRKSRLDDERETRSVTGLMLRFYAEDLHVGMTQEKAAATLRELSRAPHLGSLYIAVDTTPDQVSPASRIVGYALVMRYLSNEFGGYVGFLDEFFLLAPYRGQGSGGRLLRGLEEAARSQGLTSLWLEADPDNLGAQRLYERFGYARSERILMRRTLSDVGVKPLPDLLDVGLDLLFVGYNPGLRSAEVGHHFAGHSNRFWPLLFQSGLTPRRLRPEEDRELLALGYGVTNLVDRPTRNAAELRPDEFAAGRASLRERVETLRPRIVTYVGKDVYRRYAQIPVSATVTWGRQPDSIVPGVVDFVVPNPSGLNRMPIAEQISCYRALADLLADLPRLP